MLKWFKNWISGQLSIPSSASLLQEDICKPSGVKNIIPTSTKPVSGYEIRFVEADPQHWEYILYVRNRTKHGFVSQEEIDEETHYKFMAEYWKNYWIALSDLGARVGFVGVINNDIRFALLPASQGKGVGTKMLQFIKQQYPEAIAKVKHDNAASSKAFTKAGFQIFHSDDQFSYYTSKNIGFLETSELQKLYNQVQPNNPNRIIVHETRK